jgi:hypothetical protein
MGKRMKHSTGRSSSHKRSRLVATAACGLAVALTAAAGAPQASAASANWHKVLSDFQLGPFNLAVNQQNVYVADGAFGTLAKVGSTTPLAPAPGLAGADFSPDGKSYAYAWSNDEHTVGGLTIHSRGGAEAFGNLVGYEATHNPDSVNTYGIVAGGNPCAEAILGQLTGGQATYTGAIDSHPYSVAWSPSGWYVADAGMNAVVKVDNAGHVSTVAVLPPQPVTLTQAMADSIAQEFGAPPGSFDCLAGVTYAFEPVPTDVEVDQHGTLHVSILPGGPESPALGARGKVFAVNAATGGMRVEASGLLGATNVAVASDGTLYATELFGGKVTKFANGKRSTAVTLDRPLAVEVHGAYLYVGQLADFETGGPGSVQRFKR